MDKLKQEESKELSRAFSWLLNKKYTTTLKILIEGGLDVNIIDKTSGTEDSLLSLTVSLGNVEIAKLLVEKGAKVNVRNFEKWTPLHMAATYNRIELAKFLLENGAYLNARDEDGKTSLFWADYWGHKGMVTFLKAKGGRLR